MIAADGLAEAMTLFPQWLADAQRAQVPEANAMVLATATRDGAPSARVVLLKGVGAGGFVFFTNLRSRKAGELEENPNVALLFDWPELDREVHVAGRVEPVSDSEADSYFASRPVVSRIGAWASRQSQPLASRVTLLCRLARFAAVWATGRLERPRFWSGYRVVPSELHFRQGDSTRSFVCTESACPD